MVKLAILRSSIRFSTTSEAFSITTSTPSIKTPWGISSSPKANKSSVLLSLVALIQDALLLVAEMRTSPKSPR